MAFLNGAIACVILFLSAAANREDRQGYGTLRGRGGLRRGDSFWAWGSLVLTIGLGILLFQGKVDPWISVVLANAVLFAGLLLINSGVRLFSGKTAGFLPYLPVLLAYVGLIAYFGVFHPVTQWRILIFSAAAFLVFLECARSAHAARKTVRGPMPFLTAGIFLFMSVFFLLRALLTLRDPVNSIFAPDAVSSATFIALDIGIVAWSLSLVLLRNAELLAELAQGEGLYRGIFDNVGAGIFQSTRSGEFLHVNRSFARIYGFSSIEELFAERGMSTAWVFPDPAVRIDLLRILDRDGHFEDVEVETRRKDGSAMWISVNASLVPVPGGSSMVTGTFLDISERKAKAEELRRSGDEKAFLLRELQHRVKNGMGIIAGLVGLESGRAKDEASRGALAGLENKVFALASLYDLLYRSSDSREVSLDTYLRGIAESLGSSSGAHERGIGLVLDLDSLTVDTKKAESLGLVTVELLTDCLKHAFPDGRRGQVWLRLRKQEGGGVLEVRDDGVGLPPGFTVAGMASLGMNIVDMLASQLHGSLETGRSPEGGALFRLSF